MRFMRSYMLRSLYATIVMMATPNAAVLYKHATTVVSPSSIVSNGVRRTPTQKNQSEQGVGDSPVRRVGVEATTNGKPTVVDQARHENGNQYVPVCKQTRAGPSVLEAGDHPTGAWDLTTCDKAYFLDAGILAEYRQLFAGQSVVELGAGCGCYTHALQQHVKSIMAYDGVSNIADLTRNLVRTKDLSTDIVVDVPPHDWSLCTEVGEHIPQQFEDVLLKNIASGAKKGVVLSWAVPEQHGRGHVNTHTNDYVIAKMKGLGMKFDSEKTEQLRVSADLWWFKKTMMVFVKDEAS